MMKFKMLSMRFLIWLGAGLVGAQSGGASQPSWKGRDYTLAAGVAAFFELGASAIPLT